MQLIKAEPCGIENATDLDLIRLNYNGETRWAVRGTRMGKFLPILILVPDAEGGVVVNMINDFGDVVDGLPASILNYGKSYVIEPHHDGECEIDADGPLETSLGVFIFARSYSDTDKKLPGGYGLHMRLANSKTAGSCFFDLTRGEAKGRPGGHRAAFRRWSLFVKRGDDFVKVFEHSVPTKP